MVRTSIYFHILVNFSRKHLWILRLPCPEITVPTQGTVYTHQVVLLCFVRPAPGPGVRPQSGRALHVRVTAELLPVSPVSFLTKDGPSRPVSRPLPRVPFHLPQRVTQCAPDSLTPPPTSVKPSLIHPIYHRISTACKQSLDLLDLVGALGEHWHFKLHSSLL